MADGKTSEDFFAYFGFGSLVNRNTLSHDIQHVIPATLRGWRRHWQPRPVEARTSPAKKSIALLSVHQDPECDIEGLIVIDKISNLKALDQRERGYQKVTLQTSDLVFDNNEMNGFDDIGIHVYVSHVADRPDEPVTLIRSYLDVVMQGYLQEFGKAGIATFIDSTKGFELPILEDRHQPIYPRHQAIGDTEKELFERFLPNQN